MQQEAFRISNQDAGLITESLVRTGHAGEALYVDEIVKAVVKADIPNLAKQNDWSPEDADDYKRQVILQTAFEQHKAKAERQNGDINIGADGKYMDFPVRIAVGEMENGQQVEVNRLGTSSTILDTAREEGFYHTANRESYSQEFYKLIDQKVADKTMPTNVAWKMNAYQMLTGIEDNLVRLDVTMPKQKNAIGKRLG